MGSLSLSAQINFSANTHETEFDFPFGYGSNLGVYTGWSDQDLAALIAGDPDKGLIGASGNTLRPTLPENFLETWGYEIRKDAFQYYKQIGMEGIVAFVGFPSEAHRDTLEFCEGEQSYMFKNMYTPIWDDGANGTPVNDTNYYALYLYKTIQVYGDYVDIWEISNEPDLSGSPSSYQGPQVPTSWWNVNPNPCDIAIKAPIQYYNRMLRISYEVIKSEQPDDLIAVGGLGYASFLDGILRNTDNLDEGKVTAEYPLKGGAYFDVLSFHTYPHIDGSTRAWNTPEQKWDYYRHSDKTIENGYLRTYRDFKDVVDFHGYTGEKYPKKHYIVTETNIPNREYGEFIGSVEAQRNFTMKAILKSMIHDIHQIHFFTIAEEGAYFTQEFSYMGLYSKLGSSYAEPVHLTEQGIAFKTIALLTKGYDYDKAATDALNLPAYIDGLALKNDAEEIIYVLWAKTYLDKSEKTNATYQIDVTEPGNIMAIYDWDYSATNHIDSIPGNQLSLNGTPRLFKPLGKQKLAFDLVPSIENNPADIDFRLKYYLYGEAAVYANLYDNAGHQIATIIPKSTQQAGYYQYTIPTEYLPQGTYYLRMKAGFKRFNQSIVVVH